MPKNPQSKESYVEQAPHKKKIIVYEGPLGYRFRQCGIEEGAHAALHDVKSKNESGLSQIARMKESIKEVDPDADLQFVGTKEIHSEVDLMKITDDDIREVLEFTNEDIPPFEGDIEQAMEYCRQFIDGSLVPLKKIYKDKLLNVKFGLAIPRVGENIYDFFFSMDLNIVFINRNMLADFSKYPPDALITATVEGSEYKNQSHERRAMLWQIKDAREQGYDQIADILRNQYRRHE